MDVYRMPQVLGPPRAVVQVLLASNLSLSRSRSLSLSLSLSRSLSLSLSLALSRLSRSLTLFRERGAGGAATSAGLGGMGGLGCLGCLGGAAWAAWAALASYGGEGYSLFPLHASRLPRRSSPLPVPRWNRPQPEKKRGPLSSICLPRKRATLSLRF